MYFLQKYVDGYLKFATLSEFLAVKDNDVISFSGAGGKTTTIMALAEELKCKNKSKILITTTTKMYLTKNTITDESIDSINKAWEKDSIVIAGKNLGEKMGSFADDFLEEIVKISNVALIEADGAKRKPFKMPKRNEPVYISQSNKIVYVVGLDAVNMCLKDLCRSELLQGILNKGENDKLSIDDVIKVILSSKGALKDVEGRDFYLILNKADDENRKAVALEIIRKLFDKNMKIKVAITGYSK